MTARDDVLEYVYRHPGATQADVIKHFGDAFFNSTPRYGSQRKASRMIAALRKHGLIEDVQKRCPMCHRALTRGKRNVPLNATAKGLSYLSGISVAKAS